MSDETVGAEESAGVVGADPVSVAPHAGIGEPDLHAADSAGPGGFEIEGEATPEAEAEIIDASPSSHHGSRSPSWPASCVVIPLTALSETSAACRVSPSLTRKPGGAADPCHSSRSGL